ncbi:hypothetical protein SAMN05660862_2267 [Sphingobacterium psychroaquaticum]|uniref:Uncharacterized protein n=1 Tax=Sphingobacterium psychroaquaticum TaxID=561061 RepID=A0A1X7JWA1_9SPHI|nr:hypothetical protein SAMN05660862_2267 [Sphingobacterium psychroaquaticum]
MKISGKAEIINVIKEAIESNLYSNAFAAKCEVIITETSIEFIPNSSLSDKDWFYFGYFVREYVK